LFHGNHAGEDATGEQVHLRHAPWIIQDKPGQLPDLRMKLTKIDKQPAANRAGASRYR
jgi:hypothetical protein